MKQFLVLVLSVTLTAVSWAQHTPEDLKAFMNSAFERFDLPAMSVAVVKDGEVVLTENFGKRSQRKPEAPDGNTLYGIASLSKAFTTASIGMLVDEGKLNWDDKVVDHLPWFKMHDDNVTQSITVQDLLCHRSGLITFDGDLLWYGTNYSREDVVKRIQHREPSYGFRETFGYQNIMFMTAGEVIEAASGMSWDDFVRTRIIEPLDMKRTTSSFQSFSTDFNAAKPHLKGKEIFMLSYDNSGATAALNSSTNDMSKWIQFWLNNGIVGEDTLLSAASIRKIWSLHTPLPTGNFDQTNGTHFKGYGLGWFLMDYNGKKVVHHGGGLPGYISKLALVPEENLGVIVLTNDMSSVPSMMMYAVTDWAMGKDYTKWTDTFYEFKTKGDEREREAKAKREETKVADPKMLPVEDYLGTYRDEMYGDVEITMGEKGLIFSMLPTKELFTGKMEPWSDHAFKFEHNDPFLPFGIVSFNVEQDQIQGFTLDMPNYDFHFDKLNFVKVK